MRNYKQFIYYISIIINDIYYNIHYMYIDTIDNFYGYYIEDHVYLWLINKLFLSFCFALLVCLFDRFLMWDLKSSFHILTF